MDGFERVAAAADVREGEVTEHAVGAAFICLARSDGAIFAFDASCTHQECPLSAAFVEGSELECECHGARFDLSTGAVTLPPATEPLAVYPVREIDGEIWVGIGVPATPW